jgi:hypothetical protein
MVRIVPQSSYRPLSDPTVVVASDMKSDMQCVCWTGKSSDSIMAKNSGNSGTYHKTMHV